MSYKLTEADRKSVAVIEDLELYCERKAATSDSVPETVLHVTDGDKLDLSCVLPKEKFVVTSEDDKYARLQMIDETSGYGIQVENLGWRYDLVFAKEEGTDYVKEIKLVRENDGKTITRTIKNLSDLVIKSAVIDNDLTVKGNTTLKGDATVNGNAVVDGKVEAASAEISGDLNVKGNAQFDSLKVDSEKKTITAEDYSASINKMTTEASETKSAKITETLDIDGATVKGTGAKVVLDDDSSITAGSVNAKSVDVDGEISSTGVKVSGNIEFSGKIENPLIHCTMDDEGNPGVALGSETIKAKVDIYGDLNITKDVDITNNLDVGGDLTVKSVKAISDITVGTNATVGSDLEVKNNVTVDNKLDAKSVEADSVVGESLTATDSVVTEGLKVNQTANIATAKVTDLEATNASITGDLSVKGDLNIDDITADEIDANKVVVADDDGSTTVTPSMVKTSLVDATSVNTEAVKASLGKIANIKVSGAVTTDSVKSSEGFNLIKTGASKTVLGSNDKQMVITTKSDSSLSALDENYGHVKAVVDGKDQYLATLADLNKSVDTSQMVDRYTNQEVAGTKTFDNQIIANGGIFVTDDDENVRNMLSHEEDLNNITQVENPTYTEAAEAAATYDTESSQYEETANAYNLAKTAESTLNGYKNQAADVTAEIEEVQASKDKVTASITTINASITSTETALSDLNSEKTAKEAEIAEDKSAVETAQAAYDTAQAASDAGDTTEYDVFNVTGDSSSYTVAALLEEIDELDYEPFDTALTGLKTTLGITDYTTKYTYSDWAGIYDSHSDSDEHGVYGELQTFAQSCLLLTSDSTKTQLIGKLLTAISSVHAYVVSEHNTALKALEGAVSTASSNLSAANDELTADETSLASTEADIANTETTLSTLKDDLAEKQEESDDLDSQIAELNTTLTTINASITTAQSEYDEAITNYSNFLSEYYSITFSTLGDSCDVAAPEMSTLVSLYKAGKISQYISKGVGDVLYLGSADDELQVKSKALSDGDEHIQATIGGHAHLLANKDDLVQTEVESTVSSDGINITFTETKNDATSESEVSIVPGDGVTIEVDSNGAAKISADITETTLAGISNDINTAVNTINDTINEKAVTSVTAKDSSIIVEKVGGTSTSFNVTGNVEMTTSDSGDVQLNVPVFNTEVLDIDSLDAKYDTLTATAANAKKLATALDTKMLHDEAITKIEKVQQTVNNRLPSAPTVKGSYGLVANVVAANSDGDTSVTFSWDGSMTLPKSDISAGAVDITGQALDQSCEYGLKLYFVDGTPTLGWAKLN